MKQIILNKYNRDDLVFPMIKLLELSKNLERNKKYSLEYISERTQIPIDMCRDLLNYLWLEGFYSSEKIDEFYIKP
jgi:hypothetical protein